MRRQTCGAAPVARQGTRSLRTRTQEALLRAQHAGATRYAHALTSAPARQQSSSALREKATPAWQDCCRVQHAAGTRSALPQAAVAHSRRA